MLRIIAYLTLLTASLASELGARLRREEGQTMTEWLGIGMVVLAVAAFLITNVDPLGQAVTQAFERVLGRVN